MAFDVAVTIGSFQDDLLKARFADVRVDSIGEHVWWGFDAWMEQTESKTAGGATG